MDVTIVTAGRAVEPDHDHELLLEALAARGVRARAAAWTDPDVEWGDAPLTVVRSTWDYVDDRDAFLDWATRVSGTSTVLRNPATVLRANTHKSYLAGLERADVPVVPTRWFARGGRAATADLLRTLPWREVVAKPAIGAGSGEVRAFDLEADADAAAEHVQALQARGEVLVQPRLASIVEGGETDVVWIDGELTHVVTKRERLEDDDESVEAGSRAPAPEEAALALQVLRTVPAFTGGQLLYARVDMARDELGTLRVVEVELTEPSLFLAHSDAALERLVAAIDRESRHRPGDELERAGRAASGA